MSNKSSSLRSEASTVRSLGASGGKATHHALMLRLTAAALMPLSEMGATTVSGSSSALVATTPPVAATVAVAVTRSRERMRMAEPPV